MMASASEYPVCILSSFRPSKYLPQDQNKQATIPTKLI